MLDMATQQMVMGTLVGCLNDDGMTCKEIVSCEATSYPSVFVAVARVTDGHYEPTEVTFRVNVEHEWIKAEVA